MSYLLLDENGKKWVRGMIPTKGPVVVSDGFEHKVMDDSFKEIPAEDLTIIEANVSGGTILVYPPETTAAEVHNNTLSMIEYYRSGLVKTVRILYESDDEAEFKKPVSLEDAHGVVKYVHASLEPEVEEDENGVRGKVNFVVSALLHKNDIPEKLWEDLNAHPYYLSVAFLEGGSIVCNVVIDNSEKESEEEMIERIRKQYETADEGQKRVEEQKHATDDGEVDDKVKEELQTAINESK